MTTPSLSKPRAFASPRFRARVNWPLLLGLLLVGGIAYLAVVGPDIAPHDPLEEKLLIKDERTGEWHIPPFPALTVTGYPLGSDEFGRDLYSRLLWAIRPTMQMVTIVAAVRLVLGTAIGLVAGWFTGRLGGFFDTLISGALALPGLLVALGTIAVVGVELGLVAFIIGLSVTGWAETARLVREQTLAIKGQVYIEAAHAIGASDGQIIVRHVMRQIQAMLLMLLAFELGSTLMLTAGLGFLGYYIGGDVWVDVQDFVARRTSGAPELGQMLATAWVRLTEPWGLVAVGSVVFAAVLGFNLIGEGLRLRLSREVQGGMLQWLGERTAGLSLALEHYVTYPLGNFLQRPAPFLLLRLGLGLLVGAGAVWGWERGWFRLAEADVSFLYSSSPTLTPLPGQISAAPTAAPSPEVTRTPEAEPSPEPAVPVVVWTFEAGAAFTGPPVIAADGTVYGATSDGRLYALEADGSLRWQALLPARPVGSPALAADGTVYLTDAEGALNAISPEGESHWRFVIEPPRAATSGPAVAPDGKVYYALGGQSGMVQAVSPNGEGLWLAQGNTFSYYKTPQASPDGALVFLWNDAFHAAGGTLLELEFPSKVDRFLVGEDGRLYARLGHNLVEWGPGNGAPEILQNVSWNYAQFLDEGTLPQEAGVNARGVSWELYTTEFGGNTRFFWIEPVEGEGQLLGMASAPVSQGKAIFIDDDTLLAVVCGVGTFSFQQQNDPKPECHAVRPEGDSVWMLRIEERGLIAGAAYQPEAERLYITTQEGRLYAVDASPTP